MLGFNYSEDMMMIQRLTLGSAVALNLRCKAMKFGFSTVGSDLTIAIPCIEKMPYCRKTKSNVLEAYRRENRCLRAAGHVFHLNQSPSVGYFPNPDTPNCPRIRYKSSAAGEIFEIVFVSPDGTVKLPCEFRVRVPLSYCALDQQSPTTYFLLA